MRDSAHNGLHSPTSRKSGGCAGPNARNLLFLWPLQPRSASCVHPKTGCACTKAPFQAAHCKMAMTCGKGHPAGKTRGGRPLVEQAGADAPTCGTNAKNPPHVPQKADLIIPTHVNCRASPNNSRAQAQPVHMGGSQRCIVLAAPRTRFEQTGARRRTVLSSGKSTSAP